MRVYVAVLTVVALSGAGCVTTPGVAKMQGRALTEAEEAECSQRAMGSVEAARAGERGPSMIGDVEGWDEQRRDWVSRNNPCLDTGSAGARALKDEEAQRAFARTRARMLLDSGEASQAREALIPAFYAPAPPDPQVYGLAREASAGLQAQDVRLEPEQCKLIAPASREPVVLWSGSGGAQLRCQLPQTVRDHKGAVRLVVRQRLGTSQRQVVWTWSPEVAGAGEVALTLDAAIMLPVQLEGRDAAGSRAYYMLEAEVVREGQPTLVVARGEAFWFAQE